MLASNISKPITRVVDQILHEFKLPSIPKKKHIPTLIKCAKPQDGWMKLNVDGICPENPRN